MLLFFLAVPLLCSSQSTSIDELPYQVSRIHSYISMTKEKLQKAQTLVDLNRHYKPSWVRTYLSVEVTTTYQGKIQKAINKSDTLSREQKNIMEMADPGSEISFKIKYIPENTLKNNESKELDFRFTVDPEQEASYPGGQQQLRKYLQEKAIAKIPDGRFQDFDLATIKFTVNEDGEISNAHIFWPFKDEKVDQVLLDAIRTMPCWTPAEYNNGLKVKQEFALLVGNMQNCVVPLLNINPDWK